MPRIVPETAYSDYLAALKAYRKAIGIYLAAIRAYQDAVAAFQAACNTYASSMATATSTFSAAVTVALATGNYAALSKALTDFSNAMVSIKAAYDAAVAKFNEAVKMYEAANAAFQLAWKEYRDAIQAYQKALEEANAGKLKPGSVSTGPD